MSKNGLYYQLPVGDYDSEHKKAVTSIEHYMYQSENSGISNMAGFYSGQIGNIETLQFLSPALCAIVWEFLKSDKAKSENFNIDKPQLGVGVDEQYVWGLVEKLIPHGIFAIGLSESEEAKSNLKIETMKNRYYCTFIRYVRLLAYYIDRPSIYKRDDK